MSTILYTALAIGYATIGMYLIIERDKYRQYYNSKEEITTNYEYGYATFKDFLKEFENKDMRNGSLDKDSIYCNKEGYFYCSECSLKGEIRFDGVYMILSYKDYKKYLKFIKKEYNRRRKAIDDNNTRILKEHYNTRKWGK